MSFQILTRDVPPRSAWALEQAGIHPLLARLYAARGISDPIDLDNSLAQLLPQVQSIDPLDLLRLPCIVQGLMQGLNVRMMQVVPLVVLCSCFLLG